MMSFYCLQVIHESLNIGQIGFQLERLNMLQGGGLLNLFEFSADVNTYRKNMHGLLC